MKLKLFFLSLFALLSLVAYQKYSEYSTLKSNNVESTLISPESTSVKQISNEWILFTDTKHHFLIEYPKNWEYRKTTPDVAITFWNNLTNESLRVEYSITDPYLASSSLPFDKRVEEWKNYHLNSTSFSDQGGTQLSKNRITVDGKNGIIYLLKAKGDSNNQTTAWIFLPIDSQIIHISYTWSVDKNTVEKILSTFKFTN